MIKKKFMLYFLLKFIGSVTAGFILIFLFLYFVLPPDIKIPFYKTLSALLGTDSVIVIAFAVAGTIEIVFITVVIIFISIGSSQKLAGPVFRLQKFVKDFEGGDLTGNLHFRKNDPLEEVEKVYNSSLKGLNKRLKSIEETYEVMNKAREELDKTAESVNVFKEKVIVLEKEIGKFKT